MNEFAGTERTIVEVTVNPSDGAAPAWPRRVLVSQGETTLARGEAHLLLSVAQAAELSPSDELLSDISECLSYATGYPLQIWLLEAGSNEVVAGEIVKSFVGPGELVLRHIKLTVQITPSAS